MIRAGVPSMYLDADPRPDLLGGAYLLGPAGVGKTHAACGAIKAYSADHLRAIHGEVIFIGKRPKFVSAPMWFAMMKATYGTRDREQDVFDTYARAGFLVLDDLGKGGRSDWAAERVYMLMDYRYSQELPTIITSNYDLGEVARMFATDSQTMSSIASRIGGMCRGVRMDGEDRRLEKKP